VPTELRHADNRKFEALSGDVFLGGDRTGQRRIVHQYPARRRDPDVVAADAAIQETLGIPDAERVWFGRFVFSVAEWLNMIWLLGTGLTGRGGEYPMPTA
jgi:hypothetical protein